jgi:hypothetical protein
LYVLPQTKKIISWTFKITGTLYFYVPKIDGERDRERERERGGERERERERKRERERERKRKKKKKKREQKCGRLQWAQPY